MQSFTDTERSKLLKVTLCRTRLRTVDNQSFINHRQLQLQQRKSMQHSENVEIKTFLKRSKELSNRDTCQRSQTKLGNGSNFTLLSLMKELRPSYFSTTIRKRPNLKVSLIFLVLTCIKFMNLYGSDHTAFS